MARPPSQRLLRQVFEVYNRQFFGGVLPPMDIVVVDEPYLGACNPPCEAHPFGWIEISRRRQPPAEWMGVLLHEAIHAYLYFLSPEVDEFDSDGVSYHGPVFTEECNRVGAILGLPKVDEADSWAWPWVLEEDEEIEPLDDD